MHPAHCPKSQTQTSISTGDADIPRYSNFIHSLKGTNCSTSVSCHDQCLAFKFARKKHTFLYLGGNPAAGQSLCDQSSNGGSGAESQLAVLGNSLKDSFKTEHSHSGSDKPLRKLHHQRATPLCVTIAAGATVTSGTQRRLSGPCFQPELCNFRAVFALWVNNSRPKTFLTFIMEPSIFKLAKRELLVNGT